jgi:hypothetical protein
LRTEAIVRLIDLSSGAEPAAFPGEDPAKLPPPESVADAFLDLASPKCTRKSK